MAEPITCPLCGSATRQEELDRPDCAYQLLDNFECTKRECRLRGPAATLERVRNARSPSVVLAEAERLLRAAGAMGVSFCGATAARPESVCLSHRPDESGVAIYGAWAPTIAEAYAKLAGDEHG